MKYESFLGYSIEKVEEYFNKNSIDYELILINNPKNNIIGEEKRVIKIEEGSQKVTIYYSYF